MRAIIIAGGYATRLHPLTIDTPKHLLKIGDKPMLNHLMEDLAKLDIDEFYLVTNQKFAKHFEEWAENSVWASKIKIINDCTTSNEDRLGALGDIQYAIDKHNLDDDLFIIGPDNLCDFDFEKLLNHFYEKKSPVIGLYDVEDLEIAKKIGIVEVDKEGKLISFVEKPESPKSTLGSTLFYVIPKEHVKEIQICIDNGKADNSGWLIGHLLTKTDVHSIEHKGYWFDIGTHESYKEAQDFICKKL